MNKPVEIKKCSNKIPKKLKCICLVCDKKLEAISMGTSCNAESYPSVVNAVVFRSSGQYGSAVLDCGVGIPDGWGIEIQIMVCDECLVKKSANINATKNKRAVIERRPSIDIAVNWSDYATFEELLEAEKKNAEKYKKKD